MKSLKHCRHPSKMRQNSITLVQKLCCIFRFRNDPITFNNENFQKNIWNIYPDQLELKKENQVNKNTNPLEIKY